MDKEELPVVAPDWRERDALDTLRGSPRWFLAPPRRDRLETPLPGSARQSIEAVESRAPWEALDRFVPDAPPAVGTAAATDDMAGQR